DAERDVDDLDRNEPGRHVCELCHLSAFLAFRDDDTTFTPRGARDTKKRRRFREEAPAFGPACARCRAFLRFGCLAAGQVLRVAGQAGAAGAHDARPAAGRPAAAAGAAGEGAAAEAAAAAGEARAAGAL